jgi:hypothetical protein
MTPRRPDPVGWDRMHFRADGQAKMTLDKRSAKRAAKNHGPKASVYRCPTCHWWHIATAKP